MRKPWIHLVIAAAFVFSACSQSGGGGNQTQAPSQPQATAGTQAPAFPTQDLSATTMECQVVSIDPTPGPTDVSKFPPVTEDDWRQGDLESPAVTIIEYSDFM